MYPGMSPGREELMFTLFFRPILIAAAVIPALVLMGYVYKKDRIEKESGRILLRLVLFGVIATFMASFAEQLGGRVLASFLDQDSLLFGILFFFLVVAVSEEGFKYILLKRRTWNDPEFNCQFDGVVYAVFVALGFALWENIGYVIAYGFGTALMRAVTAIPGHACFGVFMGSYYGNAKKKQVMGDEQASATLRRYAFLVPVVLHGLYDLFATVGTFLTDILFLVFILILFVISLKLVKKGSEMDSYFHDQTEWYS